MVALIIQEAQKYLGLVVHAVMVFLRTTRR
jgi:hypothetical protein